MPQSAEQQRAMVQAVAAWRAAPAAPIACPCCAAPGLEIIDRSARPHAEWYAMKCRSCTLDETLHIALGSRVQALD